MSNYLLFDGVFGEERSREIYRLALQSHEQFERSRTSPSRNYPDWRRSFVLYDRDLKPVIGMIQRELQARLAQAVDALEIQPFRWASTEVQLTSHNNGEYYHWHTDNGSTATRTRVLSFVYYFHGCPRRFSGGELVIYDEEGSAEIEPLHDRLVLFRSGTKHEVKPVSCSSRRFEDGRFTLNGWLRCEGGQQFDYFDGRIFTVPRRLRAASSRRQPAEPTMAVQRPVTQPPAMSPDQTGGQEGAKALALLELYRNLYRKSRRSGSVDCRVNLSGDEFLENYYFENRPVLLKGAMTESAAVRTWTPEYFAEHYGDVPVTVTDGREGDPDYESNFESTLRTVKLKDLCTRLRREPDSNDYYLVARNGFFDQPALWPLKKELEPPPDIVDRDDRQPGAVKLWLGPAGTVTPLHHDLHSILFAQIFGRKRFKLIPPFDTPLLHLRRKYYSAVDLEQVDRVRYPAFAGVSVLNVEVEPGDLLFLPVGWWHWVRALDVSISASFSSFREPDRNTALRLPF